MVKGRQPSPDMGTAVAAGAGKVGLVWLKPLLNFRCGQRRLSRREGSRGNT